MENAWADMNLDMDTKGIIDLDKYKDTS